MYVFFFSPGYLRLVIEDDRSDYMAMIAGFFSTLESEPLLFGVAANGRVLRCIEPSILWGYHGDLVGGFKHFFLFHNIWDNHSH